MTAKEKREELDKRAEAMRKTFRRLLAIWPGLPGRLEEAAKPHFDWLLVLAAALRISRQPDWSEATNSPITVTVRFRTRREPSHLTIRTVKDAKRVVREAGRPEAAAAFRSFVVSSCPGYLVVLIDHLGLDEWPFFQAIFEGTGPSATPATKLCLQKEVWKGLVGNEQVAEKLHILAREIEDYVAELEEKLRIALGALWRLDTQRKKPYSWAPSYIFNIPGLSERTRKLLCQEGIVTLEQLWRGYEAEKLPHIRNFGKKSLEEVKKALSQLRPGTL